MGKIQIEGYSCERCGHIWRAREKREPTVCPNCKSPYWDIPRKKRGKRKGRMKEDDAPRAKARGINGK